MSKTLIATIVGALILFIWQFLSWSMLNVHKAEFNYSPNQEKIINFLSENLEEGSYFMPTIAPGATDEEHQALMESNVGKPWAQINYHPVYDVNMGMNLLRGFIVDLLAVFLLVWMLMKFAKLDMGTAVMTSLAVGFIGYLTITYTNSIWFQGSTIGTIVDIVVQWGLTGAWLGWYLPRGNS